MLQVKDVSKTYISKTKQEVQALKGVNFELGNNGMVFILGKSGSGKSTLLNLLGGLDSPTSGEIIVDGVSMKKFKSADYELYRNGHVGFIFQEHNLLDDFNVRENVSLALQMTKGVDVEGKVIEALKQVQLNEEYLTRRSDEMSGGEKQRVAIARAIVKDCKILLADEPTGNLDSMTGESVWKILQNISKTKLVIVVSHDRESAEKYADRVIEIADGKLISDNGVGISKETVQKSTVSKKKRLPFKVCLKMAVNSILQRKIKTLSVIMLSVFCIVALLTTLMCAIYSPEKALAHVITQRDVPYIAVQQGSYDEWNKKFVYSGRLKRDTLDHIASNSQYIANGIVENKQQVLDFGLTFVGEALELDEHSYYVTKQTLEQYIDDSYYIEIDDDGNETRVQLIKELHTIDFLVGKQVYIWRLFDAYSRNVPILAGVIDSDAVPQSSREYLPNYFARADFEYFGTREAYKTSPDCRVSLGLSGSPFSALYGSVSVTTLQSSKYAYAKINILTLDSTSTELAAVVKDSSEVNIADDEIMMSFSMFRHLFLSNLGEQTDFVSESGEIVNIPQQLGQTFPFKIYDKETDELIIDLGEVKLVGIIFDSSGSEFVTNANILTKLRMALDTDINLLIKTDSVRNLSSFLTKLSSYNGFVNKELSESETFQSVAYRIYDFRDSLHLLMIVFGLLALMMLVILVLLVTNLISFSIADRKKEIGILSALGTFKGDISKIFIFETLIISIFTVILSLAGAYGVSFAINKEFSTGFDFIIPFLSIDVVTVVALVVFSVGILLLATLIPLRKINRFKPVDAIRNN